MGDVRNPLWRKGGTVFGPQPRSYALRLPRKVERAAPACGARGQAARGALASSIRCRSSAQTKAAAEFSRGSARTARSSSSTSQPDDDDALTAREIAVARLVSTGGVTARDIIGADRLILTRDAIERLQE